MALFCAQHKTLAIHVNAAALKDHVMGFAVAVDHGRKLLQREFFADAIRKLVVMLPVGIFGPRVKAPVGKRNALLIPDKDGTGVARPYAVGRPEVKLYPLRIDMTALQDLTRSLFLAR